MYNHKELVDRLGDVLKILERIPDRFESISEPDDFIADKEGLEHLDSICMVLIATGEAFRQIDSKTEGEWRRRYSQLPWVELIGMRNVIAHGYFDIDHEVVFNICKDDIPELIKILRVVIDDLR